MCPLPATLLLKLQYAILSILLQEKTPHWTGTSSLVDSQIKATIKFLWRALNAHILCLRITADGYMRNCIAQYGHHWDTGSQVTLVSVPVTHFSLAIQLRLVLQSYPDERCFLPSTTNWVFYQPVAFSIPDEQQYTFHITETIIRAYFRWTIYGLPCMHHRTCTNLYWRKLYIRTSANKPLIQKLCNQQHYFLYACRIFTHVKKYLQLKTRLFCPKQPYVNLRQEWIVKLIFFTHDYTHEH